MHTHTYNRNIRLPEDFFDAVDFKEIYIGHTPTTKWGTDKPLRALNVLNLDTGAGHWGRLTIMDVKRVLAIRSAIRTIYREFQGRRLCSLVAPSAGSFPCNRQICYFTIHPPHERNSVPICIGREILLFP